MAPDQAPERRFRAKIDGSEKGRVYVLLPFDPAEAWGARPRHRVQGTIEGMKYRGTLEQSGRGHFLPLALLKAGHKQRPQ